MRQKQGQEMELIPKTSGRSDMYRTKHFFLIEHGNVSKVGYFLDIAISIADRLSVFGQPRIL